jgi:putative ABC transport system substrate-binding protein
LALCFTLLIVGTVPAAPKAKLPRIGILAFDETNCRVEPFIEGLRELGYIEGKNITTECRHAGGSYAGFQPAADSLALSKPAIIVAFGTSLVKAAQRATKDIPVIMFASGEPVASGFAASFSRPGGNLTGLTYYVIELNAKRLELLKAVVPGLQRTSVLFDPEAPPELTRMFLRDIRAAAKTLGIELVEVKASRSADYERAFGEIEKANAQAVLILPYFAFMRDAQELADIAKWSGLPSIHVVTRYSALGGLMSYSPDYGQLQRRLAVYVDKILKGASPSGLPIEQPTRFEFAINLSTARDLGLKIPEAVLLRADKVIE